MTSKRTDHAATLQQIRKTVGDAGWIDDADGMAPYLREWRGLFHGQAAVVVCPASTAEVSQVMSLCHQAGIAVVPQSGNTGLCGGAAPDRSGEQIILSLRRMNRIRDVDVANDTLTAEAGCVLAQVQQRARDSGRLFPLSLAAEGSCMMGGNLATNAGGINVLRYGNARALVLGLEVVLPDGRIWDGLRGLRKDNAGYDLKQLFIGAEGTLGVITAAVMRLFPLPRDVHTALVAVADPAAALALYRSVREAAGDDITGCELLSRRALDFVVRHVQGCRDPFSTPHPWYVLLELSSARSNSGLRETLEQALQSALQGGHASDAVVADSLAQGEALWLLRESVPEAQRREGASIKNDVSVPVSRVPAFLHAATARVEAACDGVRVCPFGHLGDGNIHFNLSRPTAVSDDAFLARWDELGGIVDEVVMEFDGSIAAEHGIGQLRRARLAASRSPLEIELMRSLKQALDPAGLMNPGKVVPD